MTRRIVAVGLLLLAAFAIPAEAAAPRRVLILRSFDRGSEPYETLTNAFRSALATEGEEPVDLREVFLHTAPSAGPTNDKPSVDYLSSLVTESPIDLVVAMGGPAARFVQRNRARVFATTPLLIAGADARHVASEALTANDAVLTTRIDLAAAFENIFRLLPNTTDVAIVLGRSPIERYWAGEIRREFQPFAGRARLSLLDDLSFGEILKRAAASRAGSAILYTMYVEDIEGTAHRDDATLESLRSATAVPVFGMFDSQLGRGIVGGPLISPRDIGQQAAKAAAAILRGAAPRDHRPPPIGPGPPAYDWRELERWKIDASLLPPGSVIRFREPTFWEANRWRVLAITAVSALEAALILVLLVALAGRRRAEEGLRKSREQYALAVEGANEGLWDWDLRSGSVYFSPRCETMLGHGAGEIPARWESWEERVHPDDRGRVLAVLRAHLEGRTSAFRAEHRLRHRDGGYRWTVARGKAQRDGAGRPFRMAGSLSDITDRKLAEEALRDMSQRLIVAQEDERARLARELHDDITQRLARLAIDAGRAEHDLAATAAGETMAQMRAGLARLSEDVHALSYRLHPSLLEDLGLAEALQVECEGFARVAGVSADLELGELPEAIPHSVAMCLYRVTQEALRNVDRHARARSVRITLTERDGGLHLTVRDDGVGYDPAAERSRQSLGHASMRERIRLVGGELDIESAAGRGTTISAWVPLGKEARP